MVRAWLDALAAQIGIWALYVAAFLESAGFPLPYEAIFLAFGVLVEAGEAALLPGLGGLFAASTLGNVAGYVAGRGFGRRLLPWLVRRSPGLRQLWRSRRDALRNHTSTALVSLRWLGFGFGPAVWLAGLQRMAFARFLATMVAVNAVWVGVWGLLARKIVDWLASLRSPTAALVALVATVLILLAVRHRFRSRRGSVGPP